MRLIASLLVLFGSSPSFAVIANVGSAKNGANAASSIVVTYTTTAGNCYVVGVGNRWNVAGNAAEAMTSLDGRTNGVHVSSVTDSGGSTYVLRGACNSCKSCVVNGTVDGPLGIIPISLRQPVGYLTAQSELWSTSATGGLASTSITVTMSGTTTDGLFAFVSEYSGVTSLGTVEVKVDRNNNPNVPVTTEDANNFTVAVFGVEDSVTITANTGTLRQTQTAGTIGYAGAFVDRSIAGAGIGNNNSVNLPWSRQWASVGMELRTGSASTMTITPTRTASPTSSPTITGTSSATATQTATPTISPTSIPVPAYIFGG